MSTSQPGMHSEKLHHEAAFPAEPGTSKVKVLQLHLLRVKCYFTCNGQWSCQQYRTNCMRFYQLSSTHHSIPVSESQTWGTTRRERSHLLPIRYCSQIHFGIFIAIIYKVPVITYIFHPFINILSQKEYSNNMVT